MKKIFLLLLVVGLCFAIDDVSFPNRFPTSPARISDLVEDFDSLVTGTNRIVDTVNNKFVRKLHLKDTTWDTLKARWGKIDTAKGDSSYYRIAKAKNYRFQNGIIDTLTGDTIYSRVVKARNGRIDTVFSDTTYSRVSKARCLLADTAIIDSIKARVMSVTTFEIDTINGDTIYSRVLKSRVGRIDTSFSDSAYSRISKARKGRIDTIYSDTIYSRVGKIKKVRSDTAIVDSIYTRAFNAEIFDTGTFRCTVTTTYCNIATGGRVHYTKFGNIVVLRFIDNITTTIKGSGHQGYFRPGGFVDLPSKLSPYRKNVVVFPSLWVGSATLKRMSSMTLIFDTGNDLIFETCPDGSDANSDGFCVDSTFSIIIGSSFTYSIN